MKITIPPGAVTLESGVTVTEEYVLDVIARFACEYKDEPHHWSCWTCDVRRGWERALQDHFPKQFSLDLERAA